MQEERLRPRTQQVFYVTSTFSFSLLGIFLGKAMIPNAFDTIQADAEAIDNDCGIDGFPPKGQPNGMAEQIS